MSGGSGTRLGQRKRPIGLGRRRRAAARAWAARAWATGVWAAAVLLTVLGTGCGTAESQPSPVTITLYNGQHQQTTDSVVQGFEQSHPGIKVLVRNDDEDTFDAQIVTEGARSPADVFYTENSPALEYLQQRGLLAPVNASTLAHTPAKYNSPQGDWVGVSARVSVLIYNPKLIQKSALPTHVLQLADPKYKGQLAFAAGETDFQPIVTAVAKAYGVSRALQWLDGIKANAGDHIYPDNETIADEVNRGQVAFGVVNQYYWYRMRAEVGASNMHSAITYFAPRDPGYVIDVSGAAILKSSKHKAAAQEFLAYLVSKAGQEIVANSGDSGGQSISFEYPIASGVTTKAPETPFQDLQPYPITIAQLGTGAEAISLLKKVELL
ncbi:MAG TPA: extracellular solute-binding protein [Acidimicrobiales bacterium]|nr:extracellular solute-binding protein [Acidimicrobiales bacterium]